MGLPDWPPGGGHPRVASVGCNATAARPGGWLRGNFTSEPRACIVTVLAGLRESGVPMSTRGGRLGAVNVVIYLGPDTGLAEGLRPYLINQAVELAVCNGVADAALALRGAPDGLMLVDARAAAREVAKAQDLAEVMGEQAPNEPRVKWVCLADPGDLSVHLAALRGGALAWYTSVPSLPELAARLLGLLGISRGGAYRVLVADDQEVAAVHAGGILNRAGITVRTVFDALTVLDAVEEFRPDLVLMDLRMPGASGIELTRIIREHDEFFALPVVIFATDGDRDQQMEAVRAGANAFLVKPVDSDLLVQTVQRCIERARFVHDRYAGAAPRDPVTGLWSRGYLLQRIERAILDGAAQDPGQGVMYINIDPGAGLDAVRKAGTMDPALARIGQMVRAETAATDVAARVGKRSLGVWLRCPEPGLIDAWAERLRRTIAGTTFAAGGEGVKLTLSIGVGTFQSPVDDAITVVSRAKSACAKARQAGGDRIVTHTPAFPMGAGPIGSARLASLIREALRGDGFQLLYHPVVPVKRRAGQCYEAVLRLRSPDGGLIAPADFFPAAAQDGLIPAIDRWVMVRALDDTLARREAQPGLVLMVRQTLETAAATDWVPWLRDQIAQRDLIRHRPVLIFELNDVLANIETARSCFDALKRLGIGICLNPLDEAPAALDVLGQFRWSMVRLRHEAMTVMGTHRLMTLVATVHRHGAQVIATGIEDPAVIARVWGCGVDFIQGYFIHAAGEALDFDFSGTELL
jgi:multidomain signaling protein FimX